MGTVEDVLKSAARLHDLAEELIGQCAAGSHHAHELGSILERVRSVNPEAAAASPGPDPFAS